MGGFPTYLLSKHLEKFPDMYFREAWDSRKFRGQKLL